MTPPGGFASATIRWLWIGAAAVLRTSMPNSAAPKSDHAPGVTHNEFALFCWLRINPQVAATYGIECNGKTTIGSMLCQTLKSQGCVVEWYERLPHATPDDAKPNARAAAWIKKVGKRPGNRLKNLGERLEALVAKDHVMPPDDAAVRRRDGKAPKLNFPLIAALGRMSKRRQQTSCRNNPIVAPSEVALVHIACAPIPMYANKYTM